MNSPYTHDLPSDLGNGYELRQARTLDEVRPVCAQHVAVFGEHEREAIEANLLARPGSLPEDVLYVWHKESAAPVSSVTRIRQQWLYEGLPLPVAEVGCVSTLPEHRKASLVRHQFQAFHRLALASGAVLSAIQGIPYFYRQFGYDYMLSLNGGPRLAAERIPAAAEGEPTPYTLRPATEADGPALARLYAAMAAEVCVASALTPEIWRYQDALPATCPDRRATYVVERDGTPTGYMRLMANEGGEYARGLVIVGAYLPNAEMSLAALRLARHMALEEREVHDVRVDIAADVPLTRLVRELGGVESAGYCWQIHVLDTPRLMRLIAPALERRLAASPFAGLTRQLLFNLYREVVSLDFADGKLQAVRTVAAGGPSDLRCPPEVAPMIWLGWRSVAQVTEWYPDATARDEETGQLLDTLFGRRQSAVGSLF